MLDAIIFFVLAAVLLTGGILQLVRELRRRKKGKGSAEEIKVIIFILASGVFLAFVGFTMLN